MRSVYDAIIKKKNDGQDASKREGNTTHLCAFTVAAQSRSSNPVAVSVDVASSATDEATCSDAIKPLLVSNNTCGRDKNNATESGA